MPRILLNTTTLNKGGALQTSLNFIQQLLREPAEFTWRLALSNNLSKELSAAGTVLPDETIVLAKSPAQDRAARKQLLALADAWQPDAVLTFSGPAYVKFQQPHILGCSEGWVTHAGKTAYATLDFPLEWLKLRLVTQYKTYWFRQANHWITQTETARQGLHRRLQIPFDKIAVINNSCGEQYCAAATEIRPFPESTSKVRFFCFAAPYKHKNFRILPAIAAAFSQLEPTRDFEIVVTLPEGSEWHELQSSAAKLGVAKRFFNLGPIPVTQGPATFRTCDLLLLPTLLETFSGTYPEAMAMGLPIVTSDLDFARDTCQDAALYYPPHDAQAASKSLQRLLQDRAIWKTLIAAGKRRLKDFPTPTQRKELYFQEIRKLLHVSA